MLYKQLLQGKIEFKKIKQASLQMCSVYLGFSWQGGTIRRFAKHWCYFSDKSCRLLIKMFFFLMKIIASFTCLGVVAVRAI